MEKLKTIEEVRALSDLIEHHQISYYGLQQAKHEEKWVVFGILLTPEIRDSIIELESKRIEGVAQLLRTQGVDVGVKQ